MELKDYMNWKTGFVWLFLAYSFLTQNCFATWSIIAVDRNTGEIGIAGASCTFDVSGIASVVPNKGAIVVQAASSYFARMDGVDLMEQDASAQQILDAMKNAKYQPERQQYGVILLKDNSMPLVYSGSENSHWKGEQVGSDFAVLGNILPGEEVISKAYQAFDNNRDKLLPERLMLALKAGEQAGGDSRCGTQYARSAFLMLYQPEHGAIFKLAVQGIEKGKKAAVSLLQEQFKLWRREE